MKQHRPQSIVSSEWIFCVTQIEYFQFKMGDFYLIRVKCRNDFAFIKILKSELSIDVFRQRGKDYIFRSTHYVFALNKLLF